MPKISQKKFLHQDTISHSFSLLLCFTSIVLKIKRSKKHLLLAVNNFLVKELRFSKKFVANVMLKKFLDDRLRCFYKTRYSFYFPHKRLNCN